MVLPFFSQAQTLVQEAFESALASDAKARKAEAGKRIDYYHDSQLSYIEEMLQSRYTEPDKFKPAFLNITKKIINVLGMTYLKPALREIEGSASDQEIYTEIIKSSALPIKMKTASRYVKLLKTIMLRPVWRRGKLEIDILTPDVLDVGTGETPEQLEWIVITHHPESGRNEEIEYSLWTADAVRRLNYRGQEIGNEPNPYGVLPFVPLWDRVPTTDFWVSGGDDLINAQEVIYEQLTNLGYTMKFQSFGVMVLKGQSDSQIQFGPGHAVHVGENEDVKFESTKSPFKDALSVIEFTLKQVAIMHGISASMLSTDVTEESGVSKIVGNRELDELRTDDLALFAVYEERLFDMIRTVWNTHNPGRQISATARLLLDFYDPKPPQTVIEKSAEWEFLLGSRIISAVDVAMERNPDLKTREDAIEYLQSIAEETKEIENFMTDREFDSRLEEEENEFE